MSGKKTAQELWQDYRFLTKEMLKFIERQDMELVYELMDQRERLQVLIDESVDGGFKFSSSGRSLLAEIQRDNQVLLHQLQVRHTQMKRHHQVSEVYNASNAVPVSRMNWER